MKKIHWQRMGAREAFAWPIGLVLAAGYALAFLFLNYLRDPNFSPDWLSVWVLAQAGVLVSFFVIRFAFLDRLDYSKPHPWLHASLVFVLGAIQAFFAIWLQVSWQLPASEEFGFVVVASGAYKLVLFGLATSLYQSFKKNEATLASLLQTENALLGLRENAEIIVLEEELRLVQQTQTELMPQLELLDASLESTGFARNHRAKMIQDIRDTIENRVRPLSDELKSSAHVRSLPQASSEVSQPKIQVPSRLGLHDAFRPGEIFAMTSLVFVASAVVVIGPIWGVFGFIAAIYYGLWLLLLRQLIPVDIKLKTPIGVAVLTLLALVPVVPVSAVLFTYAPDPNESQLVNWAIISMVVASTMGLSFLHGIYQELEAVQLQLTQRIEDLRRETSRFEQQLWSARRNWGYVIHGTVQSSLTAALMHLQKQDGADEEVVRVVRKDIQRAVQALKERPVSRTDLRSAMAELTETWAGVCDIDFRVSEEARQALLADADLCFCTQEILKEAVSNAVRHGEASSMTVNLSIESGHTLLIEAVNNGRSVESDGASASRAAARTGLGTQIIHDLTYFWSLSTDEASGLTTLVAKMALPRAGGGGVGSRRSGWS